MTPQDEGLRIIEVPLEERAPLESLLEDSFEGWYLRHSKKILHEIEMVRAAVANGRPVGLVMLRTFYDKAGYVYYIAVAKEYRRKKVATKLLDNALEYFARVGMKEVYASIERDNMESAGLFGSKGFVPTSYWEVSKKYGQLQSLNMYRMMVVVPGETLLRRPVTPP